MNFRFLFFLILFSVALHAQEVLTFQDAVKIAMEKNHQIQIAENTNKIAQNNVNIGNAGMLPRLSLTSSGSYQDSEYDGNASNSTTTSAAAELSYTLFDGFGNIYRFKRLQAAGMAGELASRFQIESTLYNVSSGYYSAALASENLQIAFDQLGISQERLDRAEKKAQYGQANAIEVLSAQVDFNADSVAVLNAELELNKARRLLNQLLSRNINDIYDVESVVDFIPALNPDELKSRALNNNAAYLLEVNQLEQEKLNVKIARSASLPSVGLTSSYGYSQTEAGKHIGLDDPAKTLRVGASISLNLFNGFQTRINQQNAKLTYQNQQLYEQEAKLALETEISNAWEAYTNSRSVLDLQQKNLEAAELNFKRTQELFNLGQATTTQFREAQLNLIEAKYSISTAKYSAKLQEIELLRISGNLVGNEKL